MSLQELSKFTITSKYAKHLRTENRRETWEEIVDRSLNMHLKKFSYLPKEDTDEIKWAFDIVREKKALPSSRGLQFAGEAVEKHNARLYNCAFLHIHNTRAIEKAFYLLLCGVGCGFGLGKKWVNSFPNVTTAKDQDFIHIVDDSIEGWATSTKILVDSYLEGTEFTGKRVHFNYSYIRPKGSPISHGGIAPGYKGLAHSHQEIEKILSNVTSNRLRSIDIYDILMHVSDAVLSGGIRRAATIVLFDKDDDAMLNSKTGDWFAKNPQRARSNNTVLLKRADTTLEDFQYIIKRTKEFGEPGFALVNDENTGLNPCGEAAFIPIYNGVPSTQFCNLTNINGNKVKTEEDLYTFAKAASIIGTLQATYTDFKFLDEEDIKLTEEEALLGVGILGILSNPQVLLDSSVLRKGSAVVVETNEIWAKKLGINPAARATVVKPDGNSSCVLESPYSGIHPAHSYKYLRRVQVNKDDVVYKHFKEVNPHLCEESIYSATNTDDIITFPVRLDSTEGLIKQDLTALQHLDIVKNVQTNWVKGGEKNNKKDISHSVSSTILVGTDEWEEIADYLFANKEYFTTVSFLGRSGDKDYKQAPYEAITTEDDHHLWNSMKSNTKPVDYLKLVEAEDNTKRNEELSCVGGVCLI